ncbi:hypothetical protein [Candidatus Phytoplasma fraxini]|uniref:Uncharacterized protein n=1 Tax=Ash yellows phytoplasma TaxID=35780 RepID=A0ABZ2UC89_ASHYP
MKKIDYEAKYEEELQQNLKYFDIKDIKNLKKFKNFVKNLISIKKD